MVNIFWNHNQRRLRAFWRLLFQTIFLLLFSSLISSAVVIITIMLMGMDINTLSGSFTSVEENVMNLMMNEPVLMAASNLASLLAITLSIFLAGLILDRRKFGDFGLHFCKAWWLDFLFGLGLGAILMVIIFLVELGAGWITIEGFFHSSRHPFGVSLLLGLFTFICVGIQEELLSRGYHLRNLAEGLNLPFLNPGVALLLGYLISSCVFGLLHLGNPGMTTVSTINLMLAGLFLGLGYLLTGELAIPMGLHITWNFFQGRIFGFPVSGLSSETALVAIRQGGPVVWTGGEFGPEAGILGLLAMILGVVLTILWVRWRKGKAQIQTRLAEYTPRKAS